MTITKEELYREKDRLDNTIKEIKSQLEEMGMNISEGAEELREFQKLRWEIDQELDKAEVASFNQENDLKINLLNRKAVEANRLFKIKDKPYFGSIVFNDEEIYIGISSVKKGLNYLVTDWRAPICSVFYDFGLGDVSYESPGGIEKGYVSRKRQYKIEKGRLRQIFDTNLNIDDEMLQEVLAKSSNDKMKNIVNTIQEEQNKVIRDYKVNNIIVQGIAGSGKTSVALHRVAFLLYKLEYLNKNNVLILSPNNIFTEYISDVLPDLGEENTLQSTYHEFARSYINEYNNVESYSAFVERYYKGLPQDNDLIKYKLSDDIIGALELFVKYFTKASRFIKDFEMNKKIITVEELNELLHERYNRIPLIERINAIAEKINNVYFKGIPSKKESIIKKLYKCTNFNYDYKEIYKCFFDSKIFRTKYNKSFNRLENYDNLSKTTINYEDATLFIYLKCLMEGFPYQINMREVVIDEAQDYTYLQYKILRKIFKKAHFTILGDVNQTVNPFYKYDNLNILLNIFNNNSKYVELNKTYRSTPEIIEYANSILNLNHVSAIRNKTSNPVVKRKFTELSKLYDDIENLQSKYKSIAVVTKSIDEAKSINRKLKTKFKDISVIDLKTEKFNKKLICAPAYSVKGLEFDAAIILNNFSSDTYLYYVAVTRAQHELIVYEK